MIARELYKGIVWLSAGNRPEDLRLFHSFTCKNNVILEYYGVCRTFTVSFTYGYVDGDM